MIIYKNYQIKQDKLIPTLYIIAVDGKGGSVPTVLNGFYTHTGIAKSSIDKYLEQKTVEIKNDKEVSKG